jgi:hypothetical protein
VDVKNASTPKHKKLPEKVQLSFYQDDSCKTEGPV